MSAHPRGRKVSTLVRGNWFIEKCVTPNQNISKEERQTLKEIAKDKEIKVLPADKGKATVVMDKQWTRLRSMICFQISVHTKIDKTLTRLKNEQNITESQ